jgi:hypothetical protein
VGSCGGEDGGSSHNNGGDEGRAIVRVQCSDARRGVVEGSELEMTRELRRVRVYRGWDAISETLKDKVLWFCDEILQVAGTEHMDRAFPAIPVDIDRVLQCLDKHIHYSYITLYHSMAHMSANHMYMPASAQHKEHVTAEVRPSPHDWTMACSALPSLYRQTSCRGGLLLRCQRRSTPKNHHGPFFVRKTDKGGETACFVPLSHCSVVSW